MIISLRRCVQRPFTLRSRHGSGRRAHAATGDGQNPPCPTTLGTRPLSSRLHYPRMILYLIRSIIRSGPCSLPSFVWLDPSKTSSPAICLNPGKAELRDVQKRTLDW
ncbi:hypothetical protein PVAP13_2KG034216 [Panicum virgatum]|uniref:Uncharacterized protein n=1 Tax=Panicum virgatum TaxID=38727 RepID=A0A8T0W3D7_PANVG|nr:hypothetical protein PVAP13_2KG034216 [Panicum virgatum]